MRLHAWRKRKLTVQKKSPDKWTAAHEFLNFYKRNTKEQTLWDILGRKQCLWTSVRPSVASRCENNFALRNALPLNQGFSTGGKWPLGGKFYLSWG